MQAKHIKKWVSFILLPRKNHPKIRDYIKFRDLGETDYLDKYSGFENQRKIERIERITIEVELGFLGRFKLLNFSYRTEGERENFLTAKQIDTGV